jgi:predicted Zn-dependent protease
MGQYRLKLNSRSFLFGAIIFFVIVILAARVGVAMPAPELSKAPISAIEQTLERLSPPHPHPLPLTLTQQPSNQAGDYFEQVQSTIVGALVWSDFPITVHIQPIGAIGQANAFQQKRAQNWHTAVQRAVQEWNPILPLTLVEQPQNADIVIWRSTPPLRFEKLRTDIGDQRLPIPRARSAETRYEFYAKPAPTSRQTAKLAHRMTIYIRPDQAAIYLQAAARHELGHALGIWGHSPNQTDALYFSQVRNPAKISPRDINTLKRIYQQPTRLGWEMKQ